MSVTEVVLLERGRFVGLVPIERPLASAGETPLRELAEEPALVASGADLEAAACETAQCGGRSVAVVDAEGRFHGLVPPARSIVAHLAVASVLVT